MDLETENRLAAMLMEEARRLRAQADKEGVHVYLGKPNVRGRPNSRFLTATVLGVEQANRAVEVNEMWRAREKEMELETKLKRRAEENYFCYGDKNHGDSCKIFSSSRHKEAYRSTADPSSSKHGHDDDIYYSGDEGGLRDDEVDEFLHSRAKRGRGAIGSRMDEPGPYPSAPSSSLVRDSEKLVDPDTREMEEWECRILGPEKPSFIKRHEVQLDKVRYPESSKKKHHCREEEKKKKRSERKKSKEKIHKHRHRKSRRSRSDSD